MAFDRFPIQIDIRCGFIALVLPGRYYPSVIEYQRIILADPVRNKAFARALKSIIRKGASVVADIGSGTGFLSFLASKLGAKECHLFDPSELLEMSRVIARENNIRNCHFVRRHSTQVRHPPKADVVVSETLGNFALEEGIIETMNDARRFLKSGGTLLPRSLAQWVAPVTSDRLWKEVTSWNRIGLGLTFDAAREISCNNIYVRTVRVTDLLKASARAWDHLDFREQNDPVRTARMQWEMPAATVYGFALWWEATLLPGVTLSTAPSAPRTHWEQIYVPVLAPLPCKRGEMLELRLSVDSRQEVRINVAWEIRVLSASGSERLRQQLDMQRGQIG